MLTRAFPRSLVGGWLAAPRKSLRRMRRRFAVIFRPPCGPAVCPCKRLRGIDVPSRGVETLRRAFSTFVLVVEGFLPVDVVRFVTDLFRGSAEKVSPRGCG